ncbi:uncharacterized protein LOC116343005 [Contarinia nasturtii]|uniref:uncharacterized protein LOC116343005 n=1 Tax=Contarinia nasturtii TaxID=265458 RepID=UPI0012D3A74D|nr:uncharacterized protein LOC116343005 [Contarinia nasturtii]
MKQFLFLVILSILVFDELSIKGAMGQISYETLVTAFDTKAKETLIRERNNLDPYFKGKRINWKSGLAPLFTFCKPKDFDMFKSMLNSISCHFGKTNAIQRVCEDIRSHFPNLLSASEIPPEAEFTYQYWRNEAISQEHLKKVANKLKELHDCHRAFFNTFESKMTSILNRKSKKVLATLTEAKLKLMEYDTQRDKWANFLLGILADI